MKKTVSLFFAIILLFISLADNTKANAIDSNAHVVMVSDTFEVYSQNNCHERLPIASTTKIITAIVVLENTEDIKKEINVPAAACGIEGSSIYLYEGEQITIEALLYGLLLESGNDAAVALAITTAGSIEAFTELMNNYVSALKLENSHFTNPHGLDDPMHYSSAYDLAVIMKNAMENDDFARISGTKNITIDMPIGTKRYFSNHNRLLRMSGDIIGGKTGFTKISKRCLVSCAEKDGVRLICVTLGCADDFNEHLAIYNEAFSAYKLYDIPVYYEYTTSVVGSDIESVSLKYLGKTSVALKNEAEIGNIQVKIYLPRFIYAPIMHGSSVGEAYVLYNGVLIDSSPLILESDINTTENKAFFTKVIDYIRRIFGK